MKNISSDPGTYEHWKCAACGAKPGEPCVNKQANYVGIGTFAHLDRHQKASFGRLYPEVLPLPCEACKQPIGQPCMIKTLCGYWIRPEPCPERIRAAKNNDFQVAQHQDQ